MPLPATPWLDDFGRENHIERGWKLELQRIASHLVWLATHALEIGAVSVMMYCFREREVILNLFEQVSGGRLTPSYLRIGGVMMDLPLGYEEEVDKFLAERKAEMGAV